MNKLLSLSLAALLLASCGTSDEEATTTGTDTTGTSAPAVTAAPSAPAADSAGSVPPATTAPATTATPVAAKTSGNTSPNPAHGQPGHRCDIAVGAPLNSPAGTGLTNNPTQPVQPAPQATPQATPAGNGTVRLNPAHGEPGHDCAVPVGQPLKG